MGVNQIAKRLKYYREVNGLDYPDVAFMLGISKEDYQLMEQGAEDIPLKLAIKLSRFYKITPQMLLEGVDDPSVAEVDSAVDRIHKLIKKIDKLDKKLSSPDDGLLPAGRPLTLERVMDVLKRNGHEVTPEQAMKVRSFIRKMGKIAWKAAKEQHERKVRLKNEPRGFLFEQKGHSCEICGNDARGGWYDHAGLRCDVCQQAILINLIPIELCGHPDLFYTEQQLGWEFELRGKTLTRWLRSGILKARVIPLLGRRGTAFRLFLLKDNPNFLPPKSMLKCREYAIEENDGEELEVRLRWFQVREDPAAYLAGFGIVNYLSFTASPTNDARR